jgi:CRP-like cAMP-binding protein
MTFHIDKFHFKVDSLLDGLPPKELDMLKPHLVRKEEKKGKVIFRAGTTSKGLYILKKGKVKIYQINKDGKEQIVHIYRKGEMMGYRPLLCNEPHPVHAMALEDVVITFIPASVLLESLNMAPTISRRLLVNLSHEFNVWVNKISFFSQQPIREKVALSLLILNETYKSTTKPRLHTIIDLSREDLANYVGTTVETLVRMLRFFKDKKIIHAQGRKITVLKTKELENIASFY